MMMQENFPTHEQRLEGIEGQGKTANTIDAASQIHANLTPAQSRDMQVLIEKDGETVKVSLEQALAELQAANESGLASDLLHQLDNFDAREQLRSDFTVAVGNEYDDVPQFDGILPENSVSEAILLVSEMESDGTCASYNLEKPVERDDLKVFVNGVGQTEIEITESVPFAGKEYVLRITLPEIPAEKATITVIGRGPASLLKGMEVSKEAWEAAKAKEEEAYDDQMTDYTQRLEEAKSDVADAEAALEDATDMKAAAEAGYKEDRENMEKALNDAEIEEAYQSALKNLNDKWQAEGEIADHKAAKATAEKQAVEVQQKANEYTPEYEVFTNECKAAIEEIEADIKFVKEISSSNPCGDGDAA